MYGAPIKHCKSCGTAVEHRLPDDGDTIEMHVDKLPNLSVRIV